MSSTAGDVLPVSDLDGPARPGAPRMLGLAVVVLLVAAVVSAVVLRDDPRSPAERLAAVPAAVSEEPFAFEMTIGGTVAVPGATQDIAISMSGVADPESGRTRSEMDLSAVMPAGSGFPGTLTIVTDGDVAYVQLPKPDAAPRWQKVDGGALTSGATGGLPSSTNPLDSFEQLRSVGAEIEDLGTEDVRGTETTHFRTRLDVTKLLEAMPAERRPAPGTPEAQLFASMPDIPVEVWLDDRDRPRRQRMTFAIPADAAGTRPAIEMTLQIETFDFGKPVAIDLPPAESVDEGGLFGS